MPTHWRSDRGSARRAKQRSRARGRSRRREDRAGRMGGGAGRGCDGTPDARARRRIRAPLLGPLRPCDADHGSPRRDPATAGRCVTGGAGAGPAGRCRPFCVLRGDIEPLGRRGRARPGARRDRRRSMAGRLVARSAPVRRTTAQRGRGRNAVHCPRRSRRKLRAGRTANPGARWPPTTSGCSTREPACARNDCTLGRRETRSGNRRQPARADRAPRDPVG